MEYKTSAIQRRINILERNIDCHSRMPKTDIFIDRKCKQWKRELEEILLEEQTKLQRELTELVNSGNLTKEAGSRIGARLEDIAKEITIKLREDKEVKR